VLSRIRTVCNALVFFVLTFEDELCFDKRWSTPWRFFYELLSAKIPGVRLWVLDGLILGMWVAISQQKGARAGRVKQLDRLCWLSIASVIAWAVYGYLRGGDAIQMRLQLHTHVITMLTGMFFTGVYRHAQDFVTLGKIILAAALLRSAMAFAFIWTVLRPSGVSVDCVLDHGDTVLFVGAITIVVAHAVHTKARGGTLRSVAIVLLMLWAIQVNNRRLAWVSLLCALGGVYALSTFGSARRRLHRTIAVVAPILAIYAYVGWGRSERIFKPLLSFQQMGGTAKDPSTESRNLENLGLAKTLNTAPLLGTGFGHEYIEISDVLAPKDVFPMYKYDPHNSLVGLAAFMGGLGFYAVWLVFPMVAYYGARAYRFARSPPERTIAVCAVAEVIIHANQMFGDIGIGATQSQVMVPIAIAAASRLAMSTGAMRGGRDQKRIVGARNVA
jgi:hypothetical protein